MIAKKNPYSWTKWCKQAKEYDSDIEADIEFQEMFEAPTIPVSDNDMEISVTVLTKLNDLAFRHYGSEELWWVIALRNNLDTPDSELYPGMNLIIPDPNVVRERLMK